MEKKKIELGLPLVSLLSTVFLFVGVATLVIAIGLSFMEIKELNACVAFIVLSAVNIMLSGAGMSFSLRGYIEKLITDGMIAGMKDIDSNYHRVIRYILFPLLITPFDKNLLQNIPYTVSFALFYVFSIIYVIFLVKILKGMSNTLLGVKE